jgi:hypothetical protein
MCTYKDVAIESDLRRAALHTVVNTIYVRIRISVELFHMAHALLDAFVDFHISSQANVDAYRK